MDCPVCKIKLTQKVFMDLKRCQKCSILVKDPQFTQDQIRNNVKNFKLSACKDSAKAALRMQKADGYLEKLEKYIKPGVLYDIGAAGGFVMKAAEDRGWEVYGNELSIAQIKYAKEYFDFDIDYGFVEDIEVPKCNAVIMWHTLEHMLDPDATIKLCHDRLSDDGCVHIQVPFKPDVRCQYEPWHMVEFTPSSLHNILEVNGFKVKEFENDKTNMTILGQKYV